MTMVVTAAQRPLLPILVALSGAHLLNDLIQSMIPAMYPLLKEAYVLDFAQIGLITLAFQVTASLLQPVLGLVTDHKPWPYAMVAGMAATLLGLLGLSFAGSYSMVLVSAAMVGVGSGVFHPEATRMARHAAAGQQGFAQGIFQIGGHAGYALGPLLAAMLVVPRGQSSLAWASVVIRYRRSDGTGRAQIRWLAATTAVALLAYGISFFAPPAIDPVLEVIGLLSLNAIPLAIGIAVVRYRLYEIDRLISRGISYGMVTVVLLGTYVVIVLVLQGPLGAWFGTQTVTVAISTLVVAGLFQPVRSRIQRAVDRRFDRARFDTERTAAAFSDRLRDEVDIDAVIGDLATTASGAVRPASVTVWLREPAVPS